jgi:hypothetical protein
MAEVRSVKISTEALKKQMNVLADGRGDRHDDIW